MKDDTHDRNDHCALLYMAFLRYHSDHFEVWKTRNDTHGVAQAGWFIAGTKIDGEEIAFAVHERHWSLLSAKVCHTAPEHGGYSMQDACDRLTKWLEARRK